MEKTALLRLRGVASVLLLVLALAAIIAQPTFAAAPAVKVARFVATDPLSPHPAWCDVAITLKGTSDQAGTWRWDPGDGMTSPYTGSANDTNKYYIGAAHTYSTAKGCAVGKIYTAHLTVTNSGGEATTRDYYVQISAKTLDLEVDRAIDEGLWALQQAMQRSTTAGLPSGNWTNWSGYYGVQAANMEAFFAMGHKETGDADNPYTETVQRAMNYFFSLLAAYNMSANGIARGDMGGNSNGTPNNLGIGPNQSYQGYQDGMMLSALIASDNPNALAQTGPANIAGRRYIDIAQDMADYISGCQYNSTAYGGWRYSCGDFPDNSACQWNAIALIAAERVWNLKVPVYLKPNNVSWLKYSHNATSGAYGWYGYTNTGYGWGPFADTASGMVQAVMDGRGRGDADGLWDSAEAFIRDQWDNPGGYAYGGSGMRYSFVYATFSFVKSMLLHQPKITMLHSYSGAADLDWYADPVKGVARAIVDAQYAPPNGYWWSKYGQPSGDHYPFMTAWSILMLNQTVIQAGKPVAVVHLFPASAVVGQTVTIDGTASYHQAVGRKIVGWNWTIYNGPDTTSPVKETKSGQIVTTTFPAIGNYMVKLTVLDDATPQASADGFATAVVATPPLAPVANAGGPYHFCKEAVPWLLDGSKSVNPDDGQHQPGSYPGDFITAYAWDLLGNGTFADASGVKPDASQNASFFNKTAGSYLIQLKVTDNTALSYPASNMGNLSGVASAQVVLDGPCACIDNLAASPSINRVDLGWRNVGATEYHIYRSTNGTTFTQIATTSNLVYTDLTAVGGTKYWYEVKPFSAAKTPNEWCTSNVVTVTPLSTRPPR